jgi:ketosteroid isomerase-like protein
MKNPAWGLLLISLSLAACRARQHSKPEIEAAMNLYDRLLQKMDGDSIALLYTVDGDLGTMAHGRDSIRAFLATFKNVRVLAVTSSTDTLEINRDTAYQIGVYSQDALINGRDTVHLKGIYHAKWIWNQEEGWRLKTMLTKSINP